MRSPLLFLLVLASSFPAFAGLEVSLVETPPAADLVVAQSLGYDTGGNTSVKNDAAIRIKHSTLGGNGYRVPEPGRPPTAWREIAYVSRNRDLGQTFLYNGKQPRRLDALTLRTGYGSNVIRPGTFGQALTLQLFEVTGEPIYHDNQTSETLGAAHGYPHRMGEIPAKRDDYLTGEAYQTLAVVRGGLFPKRTDFGVADDESHNPDDPRLKGRLLRFDLTGDDEVTLHPGRQYALLVLIDNVGEARGFTLANNFDGHYAGGHGIRREGNGQMPPPPADPTRKPDTPINAKAVEASRLPPDMGARSAIAPGTRGFPDVDTHRDLWFVLEAHPSE